MLFDPRKLQEIVAAASGWLLTAGTFVGTVAAGVKWLTPVVEVYLGAAVATPLTIIVSSLTACLVLWLAYSALAKKSRLWRRERFDLRVRKRDDLLGRDDDIVNLKGLIGDSSLLLIDGESGCGKSSLIAFGLVPALREDVGTFPILVSDPTRVAPRVASHRSNRADRRSVRAGAARKKTPRHA